jgi:hypothetical protein
MRAVLDKQEVPQRPPANSRRVTVTDSLWELWKECWNADPGVRPTAGEAVEKMMVIKAGEGASKAKAMSADLLGLGPNALSKGQGSASTSKFATKGIEEEDEDEDRSQQEEFPSTPTLTISGPGKSDTTSSGWSSYELRSRTIPRWSRARDGVSLFQPPAPIDRLSNEILWTIFQLYHVPVTPGLRPPDAKELVRFQLVCRRWRRIVQSNMTSLMLASPGVSIFT